MLVETFECTETIDEPVEATSEAIDLIESLELDGQKELIGVKGESQPSRCPYREITAEERFVYQTLCPAVVMLNRYNTAPIPLRVLQVAAHANSLGMFKRLMVWDRMSVAVKDPVLVGWTGGEYDWQNNRCFILARWGEELEAFATLRRKAVEIARHALVEQAERLLGQVKIATEAQILQSRTIDADWLK